MSDQRGRERETTNSDAARIDRSRADNGAAIANVSLTETAATGAQCKDGGCQTVFEPNGTPFKDQGDCVSYYATTCQTPIGS